MSSPDISVVRKVAESIDSPSPTGHREDEIPSLVELHRARLLRIDHDEARQTAQGFPRVEARAHRPPDAFHTFYINQIDRGLRFPIPKFISGLCDHLEVSLSQLTPNSFSSLLSLGILLRFHRVPISTYTLMQLIQIKRLGPGKFYISNKKELEFIGGNPSSHKGWMSRYFFIKCISSRENPWGCNMSWMIKAEMMKSLKERKTTQEGTSSSRRPSKGKRKASSEGGERRKKCHSEEKASEPARATAPEDPLNELVGTVGKVPEQQSAEVPYVLLDTYALSFVAKPFGSASLDFIRHLVPDQDFDVVKGVPELAVLEAASLHFMQALVWTGEAANRLSQARDEVAMTRRSMDGVLGRHNDLLKQLKEMRAQEDRERDQGSAFGGGDEGPPGRGVEATKRGSRLLAVWERRVPAFQRVRQPIFRERLGLFEQGFNGCLAQFRANGYSKEEHPDSFLDVEQALVDMPEESEESSSGVANTGLGLSDELIGLMYSNGRATRGVANTGLGLSDELIGLMYSNGRATRGVANAGLDLSAELVGLMYSNGRATRGV
ncbi:hypothetical protein F511_04411 [Dorcoceras hygrometricum]|uniref:Uncharacterized protein n=1 Tax=Dorcoceras hygrometricum TaxID=472368 RepID=A0A2Z7D892_9LAMI|nr:hypothetical protein F511_04411 [Dorcoceras hygrometricum]